MRQEKEKATAENDKATAEKDKATAEAARFKKEAESSEQKINILANTVRRLSRKKTSESMLLTHEDGTTTKLHNVSNVHR